MHDASKKKHKEKNKRENPSKNNNDHIHKWFLAIDAMVNLAINCRELNSVALRRITENRFTFGVAYSMLFIVSMGFVRITIQ